MRRRHRAAHGTNVAQSRRTHRPDRNRGLSFGGYGDGVLFSVWLGETCPGESEALQQLQARRHPRLARGHRLQPVAGVFRCDNVKNLLCHWSISFQGSVCVHSPFLDAHKCHTGNIQSVSHSAVGLITRAVSLSSNASRIQIPNAGAIWFYNSFAVSHDRHLWNHHHTPLEVVLVDCRTAWIF